MACNYTIQKDEPGTIELSRVEVLTVLCMAGGICIPSLDSSVPIELHECATYSAPFNTAYNYRKDIWTDTAQYQNIIIGDSTMDYSVNFEKMLNDQWLKENYGIPDGYEFYNETVTQSVAVAGNTLCDMIMQMGAIHSQNPANIIVSTAGGNDVGHQTPNAKVIETGQAFIDKVRSRFPSAKLTMVGLHPTLIDYGNQNKATTNSGIRDYLLSLTNTCWVDPLSLFGVAEGAAANTADLIDSVHYRPSISLAVKAKIQSDCGVEF